MVIYLDITVFGQAVVLYGESVGDAVQDHLIVAVTSGNPMPLVQLQ